MLSRIDNRWILIALVAVLAVAPWAWGQGHAGHEGHADMGAPTPTPPPIRVTMDALHAQGGVPKGWRFLLPPGDAKQGRAAFVALECFACHEIKGEEFPQATKTPRGSGPELTGMGSHHPPEYFAESIVNPNRVIVLGPGYTGEDGRTKMPDYSDSLTVKQLVDLVAYLRSLTGQAGDHSGHAGMGKMKM